MHHDDPVRTTLTLDADVVQLIEDEVHRVREPFKKVVNDALRRGLAPRPSRRPARRYRVRPHAARLLPGLDRGKLNALADQLEERELVAKLGRRPAK
jgi:hypothetical protein